MSSLTDLGNTTVPCGPAWHTQCLYQPARLSVQPQTAASRAQAAGQTAQKMPTSLQGSPGVRQAYDHVRDDLVRRFSIPASH